VDELAPVNFTDLVAGCRGYAAARAVGGSVGLAVSLEANGDVEVFLRPDEARAIAVALEAAARLAELK